MLHRFNRQVELVGDLLVAEAAADAAQNVLLPHGQLRVEGCAGVAAAETAVSQHAGDHRVDVKGVAVDGLDGLQQMAVAHQFTAAKPLAAGGGGGLDGAAQRPLDQHQADQLWPESAGVLHQGGTIAALQQIGADQQIRRAALQAGEGVGFAGAGAQQWPDAVEQAHQAGDQHPVGAGDHDAAALQLGTAAPERLTHGRKLGSEIQRRRWRGLPAWCPWRKTALPSTTGSLQNSRQQNDIRSDGIFRFRHRLVDGES